jgi:acetyl-CoA/propionyl-CoA carboxylase, biotin carboxylase, biotin carboxyl carrier protein
LFAKILIANRGEIAVRVIRTCADLGITSVAVYSDADASAMHVRLADEAVALGGTSAAESYLSITKIIKAARACRAEAIHPGYGFLAENAEFARAVVEAGLTFIGPSADAIDAMGEKVRARAVATRTHVPQVPGTGRISDAAEVVAFGTEHGYPTAIKACYGGGGRGMRLVRGPDETADALDAARREAGAAFGRDEVYLERYLQAARHIEVQVLADSQGTALWLGDRDCSVQRHHQKLIEESPAPGLSDQLRIAMGEAAVRLIREVGYVGAGTIEYLVEGDQFYFLEMNTRIQVEHTVTEEVLGLDLVVEQIMVASGAPLSLVSSGPAPRGHSIECRINAEDTTGGRFTPTAGLIERLRVPTRPGTRFDQGYESGDRIEPYYDSMVGKLVVWAPTREIAIRRCLAALREFEVAGLPTTIPVLETVLAHPDFGAAAVTTGWLESTVMAAAADETVRSAPGDDFGSRRDEVTVGGRRYVIPQFDSRGNAASTGATGRAGVLRHGGVRRGTEAEAGVVTSPMQGVLTSIDTAEGDNVTADQVLFIVEAMKMQNQVRAGCDGIVASVPVAVGDALATGTLLARIEPKAG